MQAGIVAANHSEIALEEGVIRHVESYQGRKKINVRLGNELSEEIGMVLGLREMDFKAIQGLEELS